MVVVGRSRLNYRREENRSPRAVCEGHSTVPGCCDIMPTLPHTTQSLIGIQLLRDIRRSLGDPIIDFTSLQVCPVVGRHCEVCLTIDCVVAGWAQCDRIATLHPYEPLDSCALVVCDTRQVELYRPCTGIYQHQPSLGDCQVFGELASVMVVTLRAVSRESAQTTSPRSS